MTSRPRSARPCASFRTTRKKSPPSTKSHLSDMPLECLVIYELINRRRIRNLDEHGRRYILATVIRNTMRDVEEVARFRAPKYLSAYLDVLKYHLHEIGQENLL